MLINWRLQGNQLLYNANQLMTHKIINYQAMLINWWLMIIIHSRWAVLCHWVTVCTRDQSSSQTNKSNNFNQAIGSYAAVSLLVIHKLLIHSQLLITKWRPFQNVIEISSTVNKDCFKMLLKSVPLWIKTVSKCY